MDFPHKEKQHRQKLVLLSPLLVDMKPNNAMLSEASFGGPAFWVERHHSAGENQKVIINKDLSLDLHTHVAWPDLYLHILGKPAEIHSTREKNNRLDPSMHLIPAHPQSSMVGKGRPMVFSWCLLQAIFALAPLSMGQNIWWGMARPP